MKIYITKSFTKYSTYEFKESYRHANERSAIASEITSEPTVKLHLLYICPHGHRTVAMAKENLLLRRHEESYRNLLHSRANDAVRQKTWCEA